MRVSTLLALFFVGAGISEIGEAGVSLNMIGYTSFGNSAKILSKEVSQRTSIDLSPRLSLFSNFDSVAQKKAWVWVRDIREITDSKGQMRPEVVSWIRKGGFLVVENLLSEIQLKQMTAVPFKFAPLNPHWQPIPPDHELMRSFHLLDSLPICQQQIWRGFHFDGRLAILAVPFRFLESILDRPVELSCRGKITGERSVRVFINLLMVVLATDYKKDQIHLPEILKRLR